MVNLANTLYTIDVKSVWLRKLRIDSLMRVVVRNLFNVLIPVYYLVSKGGRLSQEKREQQIIVSLTSFPLRIGRLWLVIESLLRQRMQPDRIILWLAKSQFPKGMDDLPKKLLKQTQRGLEIRFVDEDLRSYKKFYYTFREFPHELVVTADDDIMYPDYMISDLYERHQTHPSAVIARYCYRMRWSGKELLSYREWKNVSLSPEPLSESLFFGSGGGTLFPPASYCEEIFNKEMFLKHCTYADDVWLNAMVRMKGTAIEKTARPCVVFPVLIPSDLTLFTSNISENDTYIRAVQQIYGEVFVQNKSIKNNGKGN
jgi:hypothetical protein